jgi:hypothetical protein
MFVYLHYQLLKAWTSLYETWNLYHGTWAHLNSVRHYSLPSVCVSVYSRIIATQRLGKHVPAATNTRNNSRIVELVFFMVHVVLKERACGSVYPQL